MRFRFLAIALAAAISPLGATPADAAGVGPRITVSVSGTTLRIRDSSRGNINEVSFDNYISVKVKRDEGLAYVSEEAGDAIAGRGCVAGAFEEDTSAGLPEDEWFPGWATYDVVCPITGLKKVDVNAGRGDDVVEILLSHVPVKIVGGAGSDYLEYFSFDGVSQNPPYFSKANINGGLGDDYIIGGAGDDVINGARGYDQIEGVCGVDRMLGGSDDDAIYADETIWGNGECGPIADYVNCGDGEDFYDGDALDVAVSCE